MLDDFLAKYRKGGIVYPSAVARYLGISVEKVYKLLEKQNDVRPIYVIQLKSQQDSPDNVRRGMRLIWNTGSGYTFPLLPGSCPPGYS